MKRLLKSLSLAILIFVAGFSTLPAFAQQSWQLSGFIYRNSIPFVIPSSGSFGTNGAVTLTTALPAAYASAYLYFPAGAICAASAAGLYYAAMSSTTAATVYTNTYTSGAPIIPSSPTAWVCATAPGAYTQTIATALTLITTPLAGGFLTVNGALHFFEVWTYASSANDKTLATQLGGSAIASTVETASTSAGLDIVMGNRGIAASQVTANGIFQSGTNAITYTTVNTAANQNITTTGTLAAATDFIVLETMQIDALP